ncbi:transporter [Methylocystis bryophila]|uniref:Transporter n=2 Tax=Methylocystis bryophila TaxID=655015 RepID=A0A1W6N158_9HYPH|nr:transporter [Methylocystis bryophila]
MVGPDYVPPPVLAPEKFKELKGNLVQGWKLAAPQDSVDAGPWWTVYGDPALDALEAQVEVSNQTVAAAVEAYEQARTLVREAEAALFPTVNAGYSTSRQYTGKSLVSGFLIAPGNAPAIATPSNASLNGKTTAIYTTQGNLTWELDIWGKIRRQIESQTAGVQVSAADLENVKLSAQAALAAAYFNRRAAVSLRALLQETAEEYRKTLEIVRNQYKIGLAARADVDAAETQLISTEAQAINTGVMIAQLEHAIAMLIGKAPAELSLPQAGLVGGIPAFPVEVPATLLERRPDIAAAERQMQQENALIGVALAAYYPDITLSATFGYAGHVPLPINPAHEFWSLAALAKQTLFEGGLRSAQVDYATSTYRQSVAAYRQTVLAAFQQVEDQLAAIRIQRQQLEAEEKAIVVARRTVAFYLNQYRVGWVAFTAVVVAEAQLFAAEQTALMTRQNLFAASVALIEALGGGWNNSKLPTTAEATPRISILPKIPPGAPPPLAVGEQKCCSAQ